MKPYIKTPKKDGEELVRRFLREDRGLFMYFRYMCIRMQAHFKTLIDHNELPKVFMHGNPHTENYVITESGCGMGDFDRSRIGPYAWDITRFLCSLNLKNEDPESPEFISDVVKEYFQEGYTRGFLSPDIPYKGVSKTADKADFKVWFESTEAYLEANVKWPKKMRQQVLKKKMEKKVKQILHGYLKNRNELDLMDRYFVEETGTATGSFGNRRWLIALAPKKENPDLDKILIEIKEVYQDSDSQHYYNPFKHHGLRMIKASELYAPELEQRLGYTTHDGIEYWGREIPHKNAKIKDQLNEFEQVDIAYSVGTQLGQAHRKSLDTEVSPKYLISHFQNNFNDYLKVGEKMNQQLTNAYLRYVKKAS